MPKSKRTYEQIDAERNPYHGIVRHVKAYRTSSGVRFSYDTDRISKDDYDAIMGVSNNSKDDYHGSADLSWLN